MNKNFAKQILNKVYTDYNVIAEDFSRTRGSIWEEMEFLIDEYSNKGDKILDLGCGNGRFYKAFSENIDYIGVDASEELITIAKEKFPEANFRVDNALDLSFEKDTFDTIYSFAVFHHFPSKELRQKFLKEAKRVLKPNGTLIITVWNLLDNKKGRKLLLKYTWKKIIGKTKLGVKDIYYPWKRGEKTVQRYYHVFTKRELEKLFKKENFKIMDLGKISRPKSTQSNLFIVGKNTSN